MWCVGRVAEVRVCASDGRVAEVPVYMRVSVGWRRKEIATESVASEVCIVRSYTVPKMISTLMTTNAPAPLTLHLHASKPLVHVGVPKHNRAILEPHKDEARPVISKRNRNR